jgi:hypothetical protein
MKSIFPLNVRCLLVSLVLSREPHELDCYVETTSTQFNLTTRFFGQQYCCDISTQEIDVSPGIRWKGSASEQYVLDFN